MQLPRWPNVLILKNILVPSVVSHSITNFHFASIHSTAITCDKWKNKWASDVKRFNHPSKNHARYSVRQRRSDAKRALKDLLYKTGCYKTSIEDADRMWSLGGGHSKDNNQKKKLRSFAQQGSKSRHKKNKRKNDSFSEDFDEPETMFQATFGNRCYTWSFNRSFRGSKFGFEQREQPNWTNFSSRQWHKDETESEDESCSVGSYSDRTILGLPPTGPLKIEDVKNAFRISALKWHPDKHQGPSQATAEEKFKVCVNAYKSLCNAIS